MVTKVVDALADGVTDLVSTGRQKQYITAEEIAEDLKSVRRISSGARDAYIRRMKMRTIPPASRQEIERALTRVLRESDRT